ncbi:hypothetical protein, partial [Bacillus altitudinis]|uniref:hypothetical protein n=1 Tax=Bacillus altitudinis TaxID=293387 RepID=UPI002F94078D
DEISEFSLAIRNPTHLSNGVYAAIHSSLLGQAESSRIIGRVYKSEVHPTVQGQALVRFAFFGLRADQHANVKKYVRERQPPARPKPAAL